VGVWEHPCELTRSSCRLSPETNTNAQRIVLVLRSPWYPLVEGRKGTHLVIGLGEAYFVEVDDLFWLLAIHAESGPHGSTNLPAAGNVGGGPEVGSQDHGCGR